MGWCGIEHENLELELSGVGIGPSPSSGNGLGSLDLRDSYLADPWIKQSTVEMRRSIFINRGVFAMLTNKTQVSDYHHHQRRCACYKCYELFEVYLGVI